MARTSLGNVWKAPGITLQQQMTSPNQYAALNVWDNAIEGLGVGVSLRAGQGRRGTRPIRTD
jgi:hypothetical protein